jgi:hypothetical protein
MEVLHGKNQLYFRHSYRSIINSKRRLPNEPILQGNLFYHFNYFIYTLHCKIYHRFKTSQKITNRTLPPQNISVPKLATEIGLPATDSTTPNALTLANSLIFLNTKGFLYHEKILH